MKKVVRGRLQELLPELTKLDLIIVCVLSLLSNLQKDMIKRNADHK